jgi:hypothetical protein
VFKSPIVAGQHRGVGRATAYGVAACSGCVLRYAEVVATALDKDKLHDVLDQAVIVIDEQDLERSRRDPRVRAFHESADQLLAELKAEGADYC